MKKIYINVIVLAVLFFSCEERPDYVELEGPFASFYPTTIAEFNEKVPQTVTVFIETTGTIRNTSYAYVTIPNDGSIITDPPYDPFTKELAVELKEAVAADGSIKYLGDFKLSYRNNQTTQKTDIYNLTIDRTDGDLNAAATKVFYMKVKDDEFRIAVDSTVVFNAPAIENFNGEGEEESFCDADITAPRGWTPYSLSSENSWSCSFDGRGNSGNDGDIAMEMNNFNSPDGEAANDWLITPRLNLTGSSKLLSFNSLVRYDGTIMKVLYTTNYVPGAVPSEFTWTEIPAATAAIDSDTQSFDFVASGDIDISALPDNVYIAFLYTSIGAGSGESAIARIDDFQIK